MKISEQGKQRLSEWEGMQNQVYQDAADLATIGVGHLLTQQERDCGKILLDGASVDYSAGLSNAQVLALLSQDLERFEQRVNSKVSVDLNQNQFDALVAFCFNVGTGAFESSTLLKELNQGHYDAIPAQLQRWVNAGGRPVAGLMNRRNNEIALWNA